MADFGIVFMTSSEDELIRIADVANSKRHQCQDKI